MEPSLLTSTPGRRLSRSSTTALGRVLYVSALNSTVSSLTVMGVLMPVTTVSRSMMELSLRVMVPASTSARTRSGVSRVSKPT